MSTVTLVFGIIVIVAAVALIAAVLMQQGKAHNLSGTIAGGAETFFGKSKGQTMNKKLNTFTTIVAILFVIIVLGFYVTQTTSEYASLSDYFKGNKTEAAVEAADTAAADAAEIVVDAADTAADTQG